MKTYKEKCLLLLYEAAKKYQKLLDKDFSIESSYFNNRKKYVLRFYEGNFLHLTGVKTKLKASDFYVKTLHNSLSLDEFDCDSTKELKGYTREKIYHLLSIDSFFKKELEIQESFKKGKVVCLIAASEDTFTLGFTGGKGRLNPMTLLNGNKLNHSVSIKKYKITIMKSK